MNVRATLNAFGSGGALTCFGVVCAGRVEMGDVGPGEPRRTKTERKTIRPIPKTPPLIQITPDSEEALVKK